MHQRPCHSVKFSNSALDRSVVSLYPATKNDLRPYIMKFKTLPWDEMSAASYQEIMAFADAVSDSIDNLQNKKGSD